MGTTDTSSQPTLWAPWRINYLTSLDQASDCFLCEAKQEHLEEDEKAKRLILLRDERGILMLNRYPYTNGHLLVAPLTHSPDLQSLTREQRIGLSDLTELATRLLHEAISCHGVNVGMNLGRCAGAGVPGHLHQHIVPRWHGDVSFMDSVAGVRVMPQALEHSYATLKQACDRLA